MDAFERTREYTGSSAILNSQDHRDGDPGIPAPLFIIGAARSGTTSLARALALSEQAEVRVEPEPNLNHQSRAAWDGLLADPHAALSGAVGPRLARALDRGLVYIEKQVSLVPMLVELHELYGARFVCPVRDGRDAVASMLDWHERMYPIVYREAAGGLGELGPHAAGVESSITLPDPFDYSLPRPGPSDPWHERWAYLDRFEMCAWYWDHVNTRMLDLLERIPREAWMLVPYDSPTPADIEGVYRFAGLTDFDQQRVERVLGARVNSLGDRLGETPRAPRHDSWEPDRLQRFHDIAHNALARLGYWEKSHRPPPPGFGAYWREDAQASEQWFTDIFEYRRASHERFLAWLGAIETKTGRMDSVIDVGSGIGHVYTEAFADRAYTGIDLSPEVVDLANRLAAERGNARHRFVQAEVIADPPREQLEADLVCCHASIDNLYDIDAAVRSMALMAKRAIYLSTYRDYRGRLADHRYTWDPKMRVYFNDVSPVRLERVLREAGFGSVRVFPSASGRDDHPTELVAVGIREPGLEPELASGHTIGYDFAPYRAEPAAEPASGVLAIVEAGAAAFRSPGAAGGVPADPETDRELKQSTDEFAEFAEALGAACGRAGRAVGRMRDVADAAHPATVGVRTDVDIDLPSALAMAQASPVPLSFYLLHTAGYYGRWEGETFLRHEGMAEHYLALQDPGSGVIHEVGLHTDALSVYSDQHTDGAEAVRTELAWLRSIGLDVSGTSGHNMVGLYGAENAEVFSQRQLRPGVLNRAGLHIPLGSLDETELGLTYEAGNPLRAFDGAPPDHDPFVAGAPRHDFLRDPRWLRRYLDDNPYCRWGWDLNAWHLGDPAAGGGWAIAQAGSPFEFGVGPQRVIERIAALPDELTAVATLHPIYFGKRPLGAPAPSRRHGSEAMA